MYRVGQKFCNKLSCVYLRNHRSQGVKILVACSQLNLLWQVKKLLNSVYPSEDAGAKSVTIAEWRVTRVTFWKLAPRFLRRCFEKFQIVMTGKVDNRLLTGLLTVVQFVKIRRSGAPIFMEIGTLKLVLHPVQTKILPCKPNVRPILVTQHFII